MEFTTALEAALPPILAGLAVMGITVTGVITFVWVVFGLDV